MGRNSIGKNLTITSFGESHGPFVGVVIDGFPASFKIDLDAIQAELHRRRPGQNALTTQRNEKDKFEIISGVFEGKSTGAPITLLIPNEDSKSKDYDHLKDVFRPSHADFTYQEKYGIRDHRGGGRSSARVTAGWVAAGALAYQFLRTISNVEIVSWVDSVYHVQSAVDESIVTRAEIDTSMVRCPDDAAASLMEAEIEIARSNGNSLGGNIRTVIRHCPVGLGEPVFGKLNAELAHALFSINAVKGVEFGDGFGITQSQGSEVNDAIRNNNHHISTTTNHSGGIQGGISNGNDIRIRTAFKPTASISQEQETVNTNGENTSIAIHGRHDPCVVPRAVPIVDAMVALVLMDLWLEKSQAAIATP